MRTNVYKLVNRVGLYLSLTLNRHDLLTTLYNDLFRIVELIPFMPQVQCPLCGWKGFRFRACSRGTYSTYNVRCPACNSLSRQRRLGQWFRENCTTSSRTKRCLHFSPRGTLFESLITDRGYAYVPVNITMDAAAVVVDIQAISFSDKSFDLIICSHVLEHVKDDSKAILELFRILNVVGKCLIVVPLSPRQPRTVEYGKPDVAELGHYRRYGSDIMNRIRSCGFVVERLRGNWSRDKRFRLGLNDKSSQFFLCQRRN